MASINSMRIYHKAQQGVVLFIALIVLVAMSLAGVAMNRSVQSAMGIAGNLAFRQSTLQGTDRAVAEAISWLENNRNSAVLNDNQPASGYFANVPALEPDWRIGTSWISGTTSLNLGTDITGNSLQYRIDRVCRPGSEGIPYNDTQCLLGDPPTAARVGNSLTGSFQFEPPPTLAFRITARSIGPRNTTSIVQAYYALPM